MSKVLKTFSYIVITLFILSIFGWMAVNIDKNNKNFGFLNKPIQYLYSFPDMFSQSVEEAKDLGLPDTFIRTPEDFKPINKLEKDLYTLISYSDKKNSRSIAIYNLKNDSTIYKWNFNDTLRLHKRIYHPLLLPNKNLIFSLKMKKLIRVDSNSNIIWENNKFWPHHSKNIDSSGNIWSCTYAKGWAATGYYNIDDTTVYYKDEYLTKYNSETGEILFNKSISEILAENNLSSYLLKSDVLWDPIHSNDIQPALKTTKFYNEGDLFISARNISVILHYRPSTNELINLIEGPFVSQHDVDFYDDSTLVFFNNNYYTICNEDYGKEPKDSSRLFYSGEFHSEIIKYNLYDKTFSYLNDSILKANKIFTKSEGLIDFYEPNSCFIEQQNNGVLWIIKNNEVIYKNVIPSFHKGFHHLPNWTRIIKNYE